MTLNYQLNSSDINDYFLFYISHKNNRLRTISISVIAIFVLTTYFYSTHDFYSETDLQSLALVVILVISLFFFARRKARKDNIDNPLFAPMSMILNTDSIIMESSISKSEYFWESIMELRSSNKNYFLQISKNNAIIVPKRIFIDLGEMKTFERLVEENIGRIFELKS